MRERITYKKIHEFATKYHALYLDTHTTDREVEEYFSEQCVAFGFEMDCGEGFIRKYSETAFYQYKEFEKIAASINGVMLLGTAIFSRWRYVTHWSCSSLLDPDNRRWFVRAFQRLAQLTENVKSQSQK